MTDTTRYPSLADRVVFISGGGSGIGASLVEQFAMQGARVAFCDIDTAASDALVAKLSTCKYAPRFDHCDVRDITVYQSLLGKIENILSQRTFPQEDEPHIVHATVMHQTAVSLQ